MTEKLLRQLPKPPQKGILNHSKEVASCSPHFPPLPNHNIILTAHFPFGKSYVVPPSSVLPFFSMFLLTPTNTQSIELTSREYREFGSPLSSQP